MNDFDPTTNRIPFGLLTPAEQAALKAWPHGWQAFDADGWSDRLGPAWYLNMAYRGKPAPVVKQRFINVYPNGTGCSYGSRQEALGAVGSESIGMICVEIVDGKLKDVRVVERVET